MSWSQRIRRGIRWGATIAALYFVADLAGTFLAIGWLFDPTLDSFLLLLVALVAAVHVGMPIGIVVALAWPARWSFGPTRRMVLAGGTAMFVIVGAAGFGLRVGRNLPERELRPPLSARHPAPVLWVMIDTLRADTFYGANTPAGAIAFPLAPEVRAFAESAWVFSDAESTAGWTIPSVATLLTGIHNTTMDASAGKLPDWAPTIAERLHAAGFATHAVVDNVILEPRNGFAAGFETFYQRSGYRFAFSLPAFRMLPTWIREGLRFNLRTPYQGAAGTTAVAIGLIENEHDAPLFLFVHYMDPHAPYYPHPELAPDPPGSEPMTFWRVRDRLRKDPHEDPPTPGQMLQLDHRYANEIRALDAHLGRLLAAWERRFGQRGMVVITSDHGEEFLDHGHLSHSLTVHREMTHVPLIVRLPAGTIDEDRAGKTIPVPVSQIDLVPTTLDLVGIEPRTSDGPAIQGQSWLPWLRGQAKAPSRPLIASHSRHGRRTYRYREGGWVYIKRMFYDERPTERGLYDLSTDPTEQHDLLAEQPELFAGISARYEKLAHHLWHAYDPDQPDQSKASEETLRALGYIQ